MLHCSFCSLAVRPSAQQRWQVVRTTSLRQSSAEACEVLASALDAASVFDVKYATARSAFSDALACGFCRMYPFGPVLLFKLVVAYESGSMRMPSRAAQLYTFTHAVATCHRHFWRLAGCALLAAPMLSGAFCTTRLQNIAGTQPALAVERSLSTATSVTSIAVGGVSGHSHPRYVCICWGFLPSSNMTPQKPP